jgi:hypothetical protein
MPYDPNAAYGAPPMSGIPASGQPYPGPPMPMRPAKSGPPAWAFIVGGVVLVLVLGIVGAIVLINNGKGDDSADDDSSSSSSESTSESGNDDSASPSGDLITDPTTGLGFKRISTWADASDLLYATPDLVASNGQTLSTETNWQAMFAVGEVDLSKVDYKSTDDLKSVVKKIAKDVDKTDYNKTSGATDPLDGLKRDGKAKYTDLSISGTKGIMATYTLKWDKSNGLKATGEHLGVGVIDIGGGKLAGFVVSNPSNTPDSEVKNTSDALDSLTIA